MSPPLPARQILSIPGDPSPYVIVKHSEHADWCVLWLQGWTSNIDGHESGLIRMSNTSGVSFAMMEYAGHGQHPVPLEQSTKAQQIAETRFFYDFLSKQFQHIIVIGSSFGGYLAARLADKNPAAIVLRAPAIYDDHSEDIPFGRLQDDDDYAERYHQKSGMQLDNTLENLSKYQKMVYVVRHENDEVVPRWIPDLYFSTVKRGNYLIVPHSVHAPKSLSPERAVKFYEYIEQMIVDIVKLELTAVKNQL